MYDIMYTLDGSFMTFLAFVLYFLILLSIAYFSHLRAKTSGDFLLGSRKMGFFVTAIAAHASDMSSWIFMGFPSEIYTHGLKETAVAFGLVFFMYLNWQFIAPRLRRQSEMYGSYTLSSLFESKANDTSGLIRLITALISTIFFVVYIAAGIIGLSLTLGMIFHVPFNFGLVLATVIILPFLLFGGFITLAWTDVFQGLFLLFVILFIPIYILTNHPMSTFAPVAHNFYHILPQQKEEFFPWLFLFLGWGLGYFGQPHILTKFMGIKNVQDMYKSKWVGVSWQSLALFGSVLVAVAALRYLSYPVQNSELIFINLVQQLLHPFLATFVLCGVIGVTITATNAQILVVASNMAEDIYKKLFVKKVSSKKEILVLRISILIITLFALIIASFAKESLFSVVSYAWFGLGSSFGPALILCLYRKEIDKHALLTGCVSGAFASGIWPLVTWWGLAQIPSIIMGFFFHFAAFFVITHYKKTLKREPS